jgi:hypothetical protein
MPLQVKSEANTREHWRTRHRRFAEQAAVVRLLLAQPLRGAKLSGPYLVTFTRRGVRKVDGDNLQGAFKAVRDAVAGLLGIDDGDERSATWIYCQETCGREDCGVVVTIARRTDAGVAEALRSIYGLAR